MKIIVFIILIILVNKAYRPRLDRTSDGDVLLWYGVKTRKHCKLFNIKIFMEDNGENAEKQ